MRLTGILAKRLNRGSITTASIVTLSQFFVAVAILAQSVMLARILPLSEFGSLAAALAIAGTAEAAINARASETALAAFAILESSPRDERECLARQLFRIDFAWSGAAYLLFLGGTLLYDHLAQTNSKLLYGLMLGGFIAFPWGTAKGYITVYLSSRKFAPVEISFAGTTLVAGVGLAYFLGAWGFVLGSILASVVRTLVGLAVTGFNPASAFVGSRGLGQFKARTIWWFGFTGTLRSFLLNGLQQADLLVLAAFSGPSAVGLYRAAKTISSIPQRAGQPIWVLLKRHIIAGANRHQTSVTADPLIATSGVLLAAGIIGLPIVLTYAEPGMAFIFGSQFAKAAPLLWFLLPAAWVMFGVSGWTATFGSVSRRRIRVLSIYIAQLAIIFAALTATGISPLRVAKAVALSQVIAAIAFWWLYLHDRASQAPPAAS